jgi:hypothetical protein
MATPAEVLRAHLDTASLLAGFTFRFFRWNDAGIAAGGRHAVIRPEGGGQVDPAIGRPDLRLLLVGGKNETQAIEVNAQAIKSFLLQNPSSGDIMQFILLSDIIGPTFLENDRPVFELNIRALQSRGDE